jgi:hypothetical protein
MRARTSSIVIAVIGQEECNITPIPRLFVKKKLTKNFIFLKNADIVDDTRQQGSA